MEKKTRFPGSEGIPPRYYLIGLITCSLCAVSGSLLLRMQMEPTPPPPFMVELGESSHPSSQLMFNVFNNLASMFGIMSVYFIHGRFANGQLLEHGQHTTNDASLVFGNLLFLGMILFNSLPTESSLRHATRLTGVIVIVGSYLVYGALQCYLSYVTFNKIRKEVRKNIVIRFAVFVMSLVALVVLVVFLPPESRHVTNVSVTWVRRYHHGYRLVAVIAEWVFSMCVALFFAMFYGEMRFMTCAGMEVSLARPVNER